MVKLQMRSLVKGMVAACSLFALHASWAQAQNAAAPALSLPNGASSLSETYEDWVLSCQANAQASGCALSQTLTQQDGQRVLSLSIDPRPVDDNYNGSFILPFGLELASGVELTIDDQAFGSSRSFKTCLPAGCIVPVQMGAVDFQSLQKAKVLKVNAKTAIGEKFALDLSLKGLSAAAKRAKEIVAK